MQKCIAYVNETIIQNQMRMGIKTVKTCIGNAM
jgi:hypothetical protein